MAKRCVSITFDIDPTEYHETEDSREGVINLVIEMLREEADFPERVTISCEGHTMVLDLTKLEGEDRTVLPAIAFE